jgi:MFS family permease
MVMSVIFQNFVWGPISDKLQRRRTLIILGEVLAGIGTITVWFVHSIFSNLLLAGYVIIVGLMCIEAFWSMSNICWSALISDIYPSKDRSIAMSLLTSIGGFGRIIGISIGGILYNYGYGFRDGPLFFVASLVMFISSIPMILTPEGGIKLRNELKISIDDEESQKNNFKLIFFVFILSLTFINFGRNSIATVFSQYLYLDTGFAVDSILLSYIANTRSLAVLIIGLFAGFLSKKFGHSRTLILGAGLAIFSLVAIGLTDSLFVVFISNFFRGAAEVIIYAASYVIASNLIPSKIRAKLFGVYNTTFFLSWGLACTIISGPLVDFLINSGFEEVISYQAAFVVGALLTGIGLLIFIVLEIWLYKHKNQYENE